MDKFDRPPVKYSIVIPCWFYPGQNGKYRENETYWFAQACLQKMIERTPKEEYELILIDNGSTLVSFQEEGCMTPELFWSNADILIRNNKNLGFGPACNQGFDLARGEYIICLNDDVIVWDGWLEALTEPFTLSASSLHPPVGVVMPALMKETKNAVDALKIEKIDLSKNYHSLGPGAEFGSCWIMPKIIMQELKQKDGHVFNEEAFKLGMGEDRDLWDRVRRLGYQTYRTHKTRVYHQGNMTIGKVTDRKKYTSANRERLEKMIADRNKN